MMTKMDYMHKPLICITTGEPAGIGPEICLDLAFSSYNVSHNLVLLGDISLLQTRAKLTHKTVTLTQVSQAELTRLRPADQTELRVLHITCPQPECIGQPNIANSAYVLQLINSAVAICQTGLSQVIITAPIHKAIINASGLAFSGHTEYLAEKFAVSKVVMMLSNPYLKVALLTTHLPLHAVAAQITTTNLNSTLEIIQNSFINYFKITKPRIAVCGLNPHAGESGYLGDEEMMIINPVIKAWQLAGHYVYGSFPADTIFNHAHAYDVILAMYHDQGLPVVKYSDFNQGVNTTLGLPIIRTSVDHGTALDLAGTGKASSASLLAAVAFAIHGIKN